MIMTGGALGAQSVPFLVERVMPWTTALGLLAVPVFLVGIAAAKILPQGKASRPTPGLVADLVGRRRSWVLMAVFGLINGGYSSMIAWLAPYYQAHGWCRVAINEALPQSVWRTILRTGRFRRDSDDFKEALVARERCFRSKR